MTINLKNTLKLVVLILLLQIEKLVDVAEATPNSAYEISDSIVGGNQDSYFVIRDTILWPPRYNI